MTRPREEDNQRKRRSKGLPDLPDYRSPGSVDRSPPRRRRSE